MNFHRRVQARARKILHAEDITSNGDAADERMARAMNQAVSEGLLRRLYRFHATPIVANPATSMPADRKDEGTSNHGSSPARLNLSAGIIPGEGR